MSRKIFILIIATLLVFSSLASGRENNEGTTGEYSKYAPIRHYLFEDAGESGNYNSSMKVYLSPSNAQAFAPTRQIFDTETSQRDRQHYTSMGRQIAYAGYFNAGCDYIYMDYSWAQQIGTSTLSNIRYAIFDWTSKVWDFTAGGIAEVSPQLSNTCNVEVTPDNGWGVISYHHGADAAAPFYSIVGYSAECPNYTFMADSLAGPPNLSGIQTGYCGDVDAITTPYVWPNLDVDTTGNGVVITHAVATKHAGCAVADNQMDSRSLVYYRKVETTPNQPWTGTWEGPYFIDSVYIITGIVVSDKNSDDVYIVYLKPMYYQTGTPHPCSNNEQYLGYYQFTHEICYKKSTNNGATWGSTQYITDYASGYENNRTDPAWYDIDAMVDPNGTLHVVWGSRNGDETDKCGYYFTGEIWHWDSDNQCISVAYDANHPAYFKNYDFDGAWNIVVSKYNISWCDEKLYISFTRFGAHSIGDTATDYGAGNGASYFNNGDILVVGSDASGDMGKTWTNAINLTDTESDSCLPGDCYSEHWASMAMYSTDSIMIEYIEDKDPGAWGTNDTASTNTNNPVMFMTWPCFSMSDVGANISLSISPASTIYPEIALAPNGQTSGCTTEATYENSVVLQNTGNVNLNYTTSSNAAWLSVTSGASGNISAGAGPRGSDDPAWTAFGGCALPATIDWQANSASLGAGNYSGTITVDIDNPAADDIELVVDLVVACDYYLPEYATITGGCWTIDVWNTPQAANQANNNFLGNMKFYACGDTINPLYHESFMVGWNDGGVIHCYCDGITSDSTQLHMRALSDVTLSEVGDPTNGVGYWKSEGYWCTPDSVVRGKIEYFVPGHQDTSVLIEKVTLWNASATTLQSFVAGEDVDWDCDRDSALDEGGIDLPRKMVYQKGQHRDVDVVAGLSPYSGYDANYGAAAINGYDYTYFSLGFYPDTLYNLISSLDGQYQVFSDSANGTEMHVVNRYKEGSLAPGDTLTFCKLKAVSLTGVADLGALIDKGKTFIENYNLCEPQASCQGRCGNANGDASVNVSDAVYVINYVFVGGNAPLPVKACGNANGDMSLNVSDAVYIINFVFVGGASPGDCHPGVWDTNGGDCCPY